jgi:cytochrome c-type biogenesis protein CcmH/NrfG
MLANEANDADAWHGLGIVALQGGRLQDAEQALSQAISLAPERAEYWTNLSGVF